MMNNYPIFFYSEPYLRIESLKPELPQEPQKPELKLVKKNWFEQLILWGDDADDYRINTKRRLKYEIALAEYQQKLEEYTRKITEILSETNLKNFRQQERERAIFNTNQGSELSHDVLRGRYETIFYEYLKNKFGNLIRNNIEFELPNGRAYVPDFAYINTTNGLCIDIEIDEPYTIPDGQPIHYEGIDDIRNEFFTSKGWFIVRLAEEQIAKHPQLCIDFISGIINSILTGEEIKDFQYQIPHWTYTEAQEMFINHYRTTY